MYRGLEQNREVQFSTCLSALYNRRAVIAVRAGTFCSLEGSCYPLRSSGHPVSCPSPETEGVVGSPSITYIK